MTGYGSHQEQVGCLNILIEIRSVNHRYLDFTCRLPRGYGFLEEGIKLLVQSSVARGKVDVFVSISMVGGRTTAVSVNESLLQGYLDALRRIGTEYGVRDDTTVSMLARLPDVFLLSAVDESSEEVSDGVLHVAKRALDAFVEMRSSEGMHTQRDMLSRIDSIESTLTFLHEAVQNSVDDYRISLNDLLKSLPGYPVLEEARVVAEVALYAEKLNVAEEIVRLHSHIEAFRQTVELNEPTGRKLEFILQEMVREVNTIGSKSQSVDIARVVIENKSQLEKIREQVQNIE